MFYFPREYDVSNYVIFQHVGLCINKNQDQNVFPSGDRFSFLVRLVHHKKQCIFSQMVNCHTFSKVRGQTEWQQDFYFGTEGKCI